MNPEGQTQSVISSKLEQLEKRQEETSRNIGFLHDKISSVIRPIPASLKSNETNLKELEDSTALTCRLEKFIKFEEDMQKRICELIENCQL